MMTKTCAATGLVIAALGGALLMSSPASAITPVGSGDSNVNTNDITNSNTSTNTNTNTNTAAVETAGLLDGVL